MKKTVLLLTIFASTTAIAYADKSDSGQVYFGVQRGYSKQMLIDGTNQQKSFGISENGYSFTEPSQPLKFYIGYESSKEKSLRYDVSMLFDDAINDSIKKSDTVTRNIKIKRNSIATTIYWDFYKSSSITPYISYSGIILSSDVSIEDNDSTSSKPTKDYKSATQGAWGVGLGFSYKISTNWRADVGVMYIRDGLYYLPNPSNFNYDTSTTTRSWEKIEIINAMAGLRYNF